MQRVRRVGWSIDVVVGGLLVAAIVLAAQAAECGASGPWLAFAFGLVALATVVWGMVAAAGTGDRSLMRRRLVTTIVALLVVAFVVTRLPGTLSCGGV